MSLVAHLVRKDWDRARSGLVAWYALIAGKAWCVAQLLRSADPASNFDPLGGFVDTLNGLEAVAGAVLAARLALDDSPHDPHAFLATRPLSRVQLLQAKTLGACLFFLAAPLLLLAPVWISAGFTAPDMLVAAADWALLQGLLVALGLLGGALVRDLGRLFFGGALLGLALLIFAVWLRRSPGPDLWQSASAVLGLAAVGIVLAYRLRRRSAGMVFIVLGLFVIAGFGPPAASAPERLLAWPEGPVLWQGRAERDARGEVWRFFPPDWKRDGRSLLVQSARARTAVLPDGKSTVPSPRFFYRDDASASDIGLIPTRLGTVRAASLHVTRWRFDLPEEIKRSGPDAHLAAEAMRTMRPSL